MPVNDNHSEKISDFHELYITIITYLFGDMGVYPNLSIKKGHPSGGGILYL